MTHPRNIVGPAVRSAREAQGITQPTLVAKLNLLGWNISREVLAKIECRFRWVADFELVLLARALGITPASLLAEADLDFKVPEHAATAAHKVPGPRRAKR